MTQLLEALRHKTGGPGLDSRWGPWRLFYPHSVVLVPSQRSALRPDNYAVLVVPTVKVMKPNNSPPPHPLSFQILRNYLFLILPTDIDTFI